ncbi:PQQ-binding-like beta-propeller repeat protein [Legionella israelensis]|uniref:PQQ enzyme repeat protein n=1 Tax=Legionella israelensis TaxID=454 RepID=A0A0W0W8T8_9GAMM|nr:PQQ-binding-like beta-propeller repeat protein [Legionella israelensis]KTD28770.1 PQQ enzyme repeat protein [Legionella israelensis]QBS09431.1 hypothetical protein E4T55_05905 [Legionella israelensis]SCX87639.1 Outer membrane protein assembly factor BamB, contains PQQ-like beta-propeller repeat [Legionella israelensis DSM 19235]STX60334.1 PQQ enzyme repeat [Legionella israelensis]
MNWSQYQGNISNTGFIPRRTEPAINPSWTLQTSPIGYASPSIGLEGDIYLGSLDGQLFAISPDGFIRWKKELMPGLGHTKITASAAVDHEGNVYVIDTFARQEADHRIGETDYRQKIDSKLHCYDKDGNKKWQFSFPDSIDPYSKGSYTFSSPKILENEAGESIIFTTMMTTEGANTVHYIIAIDQSGNLLEQQQHSSYPPEAITGGTDWGDLWDSIWDFISSPVDFDTSGIPGSSSAREQYMKLVGSRPPPSLAIVNSLHNLQNPVIIFEDGVRTLAAYAWRNRDLLPIWKRADRKFRYRSSPAVFPNETIVIGQEDGKVLVFNAADGSNLYHPWVKAGKAVVSPIASFGRQLYVCAMNTFSVIDSGNELYKEIHYPSYEKVLAAPSLSASYCYLLTSHGLYTHTFEGEKHSRAQDFPGGVSTPAIAKNGGIYAVDLTGKLWAFNSGGSTRSNSRRKTERIRARRSVNNR